MYNGLFCTYYALGPGPGIQEVAKLITVTIHLHFLFLSTITAIIYLTPWANLIIQAGLISCIEIWVVKETCSQFQSVTETRYLLAKLVSFFYVGTQWDYISQQPSWLGTDM